MSFLSFQTSAVRIEDYQTDDVFYVFPDEHQKSVSLPESLDDAYGQGFLTISLYDSKFSTWYLNIANEEYTGSFQKLKTILYDWAMSEGYVYQ
jgi:hypothetical protein